MSAQIITANRLRDGAVVYLTRDGGWSEWIDDARILAGKEEGDAALAQAERPEERVRVIGPYLMPVAEEDGRPRPLSVREVIRAKGPSVHPELGKQAAARPHEGA